MSRGSGSQGLCGAGWAEPQAKSERMLGGGVWAGTGPPATQRPRCPPQASPSPSEAGFFCPTSPQERCRPLTLIHPCLDTKGQDRVGKTCVAQWAQIVAAGAVQRMSSTSQPGPPQWFGPSQPQGPCSPIRPSAAALAVLWASLLRSTAWASLHLQVRRVRGRRRDADSEVAGDEGAAGAASSGPTET